MLSRRFYPYHEESRVRVRRRLLLSLLKKLGAAMYLVARPGLALLGPGSGLPNRAIILAVVGCASLAAYLVTSLLLETEELGAAVSLLHRPK